MDVLILRPEHALARVVETILKSHGHRSLQSATAEDAERILRHETVHAVILVGPSIGVGGRPWLRSWLSKQGRSLPPLLVIAAEELGALDRAEIEAHPSILLDSPISPRRLLEALHSLGTRRSRHLLQKINRPPTADH